MKPQTRNIKQPSHLPKRYRNFLKTTEFKKPSILQLIDGFLQGEFEPTYVDPRPNHINTPEDILRIEQIQALNQQQDFKLKPFATLTDIHGNPEPVQPFLVIQTINEECPIWLWDNAGCTLHPLALSLDHFKKGIAAAQVSTLDHAQKSTAYKSFSWKKRTVPPTRPNPEQQIQSALHSGAKELDLSNFNLKELPPQLWELKQLEVLNLCENKLKTLPNDIIKLTRLKVLNLSDNTIETLPDCILRLTRLEKLSLNSLPLKHLPPLFGKLRNLKQLEACSAKLKTLPGSIANLEQLEYLNLNCCSNLTFLPPEIRHLKSLTCLDLGGTSLTKLPPEIKSLSRLCELNLKGTKVD